MEFLSSPGNPARLSLLILAFLTHFYLGLENQCLFHHCTDTDLLSVISTLPSSPVTDGKKSTSEETGEIASLLPLSYYGTPLAVCRKRVQRGHHQFNITQIIAQDSYNDDLILTRADEQQVKGTVHTLGRHRM